MTDVGLGSLATASVIAAPRGHNTLRRLLRHRSFVIGFSVILLLTLAAVLAPLISPVDPSAMRVRLRFRPPSSQFLFGTDMFGRDVFTRVLYGARVSLFVGIAVCVISGLCSAIIGVIAAQFRRLDAQQGAEERHRLRQVGHVQRDVEAHGIAHGRLDGRVRGHSK